MNAMVFDVDGTLVDSNGAHVEAWLHAFSRHGFDVERHRIRRELGKGGDLLVSSVLGERTSAALTATIADEHTAAFVKIARSTHFSVFRGVAPLMRELRRLRVARAVASSSRRQELEATLASAGLQLNPWFEHVLTAEDIQASKPEPDAISAAIARLNATPFRTLMVGDTRYDGIAALRAGAGFVGLTCGGTTAEALIAVGARWVFPDLQELLTRIPAVLDVMPAARSPEARPT